MNPALSIRIAARPRLRWQLWFLALILPLMLLSAEILRGQGWTARLDAINSDFWFRMAGVRYPARHVALVVVDETALNAAPDRPTLFWSPFYAKAIEVLNQVGARVVVLDFLFSGSPETWMAALGVADRQLVSQFDIPFRKALNSGQVVLAASLITDAQGEQEPLLPQQEYLFSLPDQDLQRSVAYADLKTDMDGVVRRFYLQPPLRLPADIAADAPHLTLGALAALRGAGIDPKQDTWRPGGRLGQTFTPSSPLQPIGFVGPPGSLPRVSLARLLAEGAASHPAVQALSGKVVFIGMDYQGMNDTHLTPYGTGAFGHSGKLMAGVELQANITESMLAGRVPVVAHTGWHLLLFAPLALLAASLWLQIRLPFALLSLLGLEAGLWLLGYYALQRDVLWPVAADQLALLAGFILFIALSFRRASREREHLLQTFGRYVSDGVMHSLMASERLPALGGEKAEISVLFCDIRSFTTLSERLDAHEVVEILNRYFERACVPLLAEGGTIDKFIGDAIMVEFGAPLPDPDHALRAVRAGLALHQVVLEMRHWMRRRFAGRDLPEFDIGIGIHSGEAVMGNIGSTRRMEYTAIGDTVNLASRLEGLCRTLDCRLLASASTVRAIYWRQGEVLRLGPAQRVQVKGKADAVEVYPVLGLV